jgi:hypothetical protein
MRSSFCTNKHWCVEIKKGRFSWACRVPGNSEKCMQPNCECDAIAVTVQMSAAVIHTAPLPPFPYYTITSYLKIWNIWSSKGFFSLHSSFATSLWNSISNVWSQWRWRCGLWGIWEGGDSDSTTNEHWESPQRSCQYWQHLQGLCSEMWHVSIFTI